MSLTKASYSLINGAPANVVDFGAVGDGVTNDAPAFQAAIDSGAKYIIIPAPPTTYLLTTSLNMTNLYGVTFDFQASCDINNNPPQNVVPIIARHTGAVFDLTGSFDCCFINANVNGSATTTPSCMFLLARTSSGASAGRHRFFNPRSSGNFSTTVLYNYGSEEIDVYSAMFFNNQAGKSCVYLTAYNSASLTSAYQTIATGAQSNVCHRFYGGSFYAQGNSGVANETCFFLDAAGNLSIDGAFLYCPYGIACIYASSTNSVSNIVSVTNCRGEVSGTLPTYGIYFGGGATRTYTTWTITGCQLPANSYAVYGADNITFNQFLYQNIIAPQGFGISAFIISFSFINHATSFAGNRNSGSSNVWIGNAAARTAIGQGGLFLSADTDSVATGTVKTVYLDGTQANFIVPTTDNTVDFGQASARWKTIYAGTGAINTSDEREKQDVKNLSETERQVAIAIKGLIKSFKFKDAVVLKGDKARIHFGVMAQQVAEAFKIVGLNPDDYGLFCYDEWEDNEEIGLKAGNRYGVRYEELLAFVVAAL
jgi:hypothetical protein